MSAIVVIGNKTHKVSGPVVKELLSELQRQTAAAALLSGVWVLAELFLRACVAT